MIPGCGCPRCRGFLVYDPDLRGMVCLNCGRCYYMLPIDAPATTTLVGKKKVRKLPRVNNRIKAEVTRNNRWRAKNQEVIDYLDQGLTVKKIAVLTGCGERTIRAIQERIRDSGPIDGGEDDGNICPGIL